MTNAYQPTSDLVHEQVALICLCLVGYLRPDIPGQKKDIDPA